MSNYFALSQSIIASHKLCQNEVISKMRPKISLFSSQKNIYCDRIETNLWCFSMIDCYVHWLYSWYLESDNNKLLSKIASNRKNSIIAHEFMKISGTLAIKQFRDQFGTIINGV